MGAILDINNSRTERLKKVGGEERGGGGDVGGEG